MNRSSQDHPQLGRYRILGYLGKGGMGEVYKAVHLDLHRLAALKRVKVDKAQDSSTLLRFFNEARIQAGLQHPNIATLYDFFEVEGQHYIAMEYVDGRTLDEQMRATGTFPVAEALPILRDLAQAVRYLHEHGVIHRDIKLCNVKINSAGQAKLLDFGIAKVTAVTGLTVTGGIVGTLPYLTPEQLKGGAADARTDVWQLGILLYEMIVGRPPFAATTTDELCLKILRAAYVPPSQLNPAVARPVEQIIVRCLKKEPDDRYQSMQDLLRDVSAITAKPPSQARTFSFAAAKWPLIAVVVSLLVLLGGYGVWSLWPTSSVSQGQLIHTRISCDVVGATVFRLTPQTGEWKEIGVTGEQTLQVAGAFGEKITLKAQKTGFHELQIEFEVSDRVKEVPLPLEPEESEDRN